MAKKDKNKSALIKRIEILEANQRILIKYLNDDRLVWQGKKLKPKPKSYLHNPFPTIDDSNS